MADDAIIDPYLLATGYARAARNRGVVFRSGVEVTGLLCSGRTVEGVRTSNGDIRARSVVDAGGAWAGLLARGVGVGLPMAPVRSHYWITAPESGFPRDMPYVILPDASAYVRPELGGLIIGLREPVSLSVDPRTIPTDITGVSFGDEADGWQILMEGRERLLAFYPTLDEAQFVRFIAGLSTYTPDGQFVLGAVPDLQGYVVATGCCGAGIAASGGIGLAVAEIVAGRPNSFDLTPFWPTRFNGIDPVSLAFRARCAAARSAKVSG
jgi:4-methylaminobutanoate oxidase (formaldehyde-forming)